MKILDHDFGVEIDGPLCFEVDAFHDDRGFFMETFNAKIWSFMCDNSDAFRERSEELDDGEKSWNADWLQDNHSWSKAGTLRGLHYQERHYAQAKIVRAATGVVSDYLIDIRHDSPTFGQWTGYILDKPWKILYVPIGFAHGFHADNDADFTYKVDNEYAPDHQGGVNPFDPDVNIDYFMIKGEDSFLISDKDKALPFLRDIDKERL